MAKTKKAASGSAKKPGIKARRQLASQLATPARSNAGAIIMTTILLGATGVAGYFGWQYYKKKKNLVKTTPVGEDIFKDIKDTVVTPPPIIPKVDTPHTSDDTGTKKTYSTPRNDDFPLKKGSKGEMVRQLQQALIDKYGRSVLPRYGADGDFGSETQNALKKQGLPTTVSETTFNVIVQGGSGSASDTQGLAQNLHDAAASKNINSVISLLKNIKNKNDYQQVSNSFINLRLNGVRQTLVNGLLSSFSSEDQKQKIRMEFIRMGLQYNGSKWSLSGFDGKPVVTKEATSVWVNPTQSIQVPALMVLGNEITQRLDYTLFENNNKYFLVKTTAIKYL